MTPKEMNKLGILILDEIARAPSNEGGNSEGYQKPEEALKSED